MNKEESQKGFWERRVYWIAGALLLFMFLVACFSSFGNPFNKKGNPGDSGIVDEVAHIPAAYSYLKFQDYRLNPEHPPLFKDLAAFPLLFLDLDFPLDHICWNQDVNGQWECGWQFIYHIGNNADQILFWSRLPIILMMVVLGFFIFRWTKDLFGSKAALIALALYSFEPTIIAHSRFVTTDLAIATFTLISLYYFSKFLKKLSWKNVLKAGIALGLAQLAKFSAAILVVFFIGIVLVYALNRKEKVSFKLFWLEKIKNVKLANLWAYVAGTFSLFVIAFVLIGIFYIFHVWNMPTDKVLALIDQSVYSKDLTWVKDGLKSLAQKNIVFKAYAQYFLGVSMVYLRAFGGNTTYFLGEYSNAGWRSYFPLAYLLKVPLAIHIMTIVALVVTLKEIFKRQKDRTLSLFKRLRSYFEEKPGIVLAGLFILAYTALSVSSTLNIGVRHLLPIFPLVLFLVGGKLGSWMRDQLKRRVFVAIGIVWVMAASLYAYPSYLSYYNELSGKLGSLMIPKEIREKDCYPLVGTPTLGYRYITDSNFDWGQDLKRLNEWLIEEDIDKIKVDYFGGGDPGYYLGDRFEEWHSANGEASGYLAVSATYFNMSKYYEEIEGIPSYDYLENHDPIARIGYSILVYKLP